jgi:hypothetical protein
MDSFNAPELKQFIIDSVASSYAAGDKAKKIKERDGSTTITFTKGNYVLHDNYFGGEPYGGREVVFFNGKSVWMMAYHGVVRGDTGGKTVYAFLMKALLKAPKDFPFRGPALLEEGEWRYENAWDGDELHFSGAERIFVDNASVYNASYVGGLVDQRHLT